MKTSYYIKTGGYGYFLLLLLAMMIIPIKSVASESYKDYVAEDNDIIPNASEIFVYPTTGKESLDDYAYYVSSANENIPLLVDPLSNIPMKWNHSSQDKEVSGYKDYFDCSFGSMDCGVKNKCHTGIDWVLGSLEGFGIETDPQNSHRPVYAINDGLVVYSGIPKEPGKNALGMVVIIKHKAPEGKYFFIPLHEKQTRTKRTSKYIYSYYLHLDNELFVSKGDFVTKGQKIGRLYHVRKLKSLSEDPDVREIKKRFEVEYKSIRDNLPDGETKEMILGSDYEINNEFTNEFEYQPHLHFELWTDIPSYIHDGYDWLGEFKVANYFSPEDFLKQKNQFITCNNFPDIGVGEWFCHYVEKLHQEDVVRGDYADGFYRPGRNVNRAEFLKMALVAKYGHDKFKFSPDTDPFKDVPRTEWFAPYVAVAKTDGIIIGYDDEQGEKIFLPAQEINRAEAVKILLKTFDIAPNYNEGEKTDDEIFYDVKDETQWFYRYVYTSREKNIVQGYGSGIDCEMEDQQDGLRRFCPQKTINRAEAAKIICIVKYGEKDCKEISCCDID